MQKTFIQNLILLLTLNLLIKPFWVFGIEAEVQRQVGTESYGLYFALFNFSFLLNILLDFGITNFNNKNIAQNNHLITKHFSSILFLKLLLGCIFMLVTMIIGFTVGYNKKELGLLAMMGFNQFLSFMIMYLRSNLAGLHLFKTDSIISVLDRSLMIILCGAVLWGHVLDEPMTIELFVYTQTLSYLIATGITLAIVIRKAHFKRLKWNYPFFLLILKKSFPYAILVLLMTFYNRIDAVMLERMLPDGKLESGLYAAAYRVLDSANMFSFLFAGLLLPMFSRMLRFKEPVEHLVKLAFTILITPAVIAVCAALFFSQEIMGLLYNAHVDESAAVFRIIMGCFIASSLTYIFGTLLTANGNLRQLNVLAASGMAINLLLNLILIPRFHATGAAFSSLITQSTSAILQMLLAQKLFGFRINKRLIAQVTVFIPACLLIAWLCSNLFDNWVSGFFLLVFLGTGLAFSIGLLHIKSIYRILKYG
ncbi:MAG: oligosaccharide flippase family protein [Bacteroidia bacterium]|nr:oligosaccharide flippase family protein [Bacteroidia bacterium]MCC6769071.1 oligosaccharide flippase family protein [Bacteroidia bacterium]